MGHKAIGPARDRRSVMPCRLRPRGFALTFALGRHGACVLALVAPLALLAPFALSPQAPVALAASTPIAAQAPSIVASAFESSSVAIAWQESVHFLTAQARVYVPAGTCTLLAQGTPLTLTTPVADANPGGQGFSLPGPSHGGEVLSATAGGPDGSVAANSVALPTAGSTLAQFSAAPGPASYTLSESLQYAVPSDAYAGTYSASVLLSLTCTPPPVSSAAG